MHALPGTGAYRASSSSCHQAITPLRSSRSKTPEAQPASNSDQIGFQPIAASDPGAMDIQSTITSVWGRNKPHPLLFVAEMN
jgi:hypothetical protein